MKIGRYGAVVETLAVNYEMLGEHRKAAELYELSLKVILELTDAKWSRLPCSFEEQFIAESFSLARTLYMARETDRVLTMLDHVRTGQQVDHQWFVACLRAVDELASVSAETGATQLPLLTARPDRSPFPLVTRPVEYSLDMFVDLTPMDAGHIMINGVDPMNLSSADCEVF
ncbi:hypothetical protein [Lentzea cavernae]|uniref:Tetratricopeptide repeat-containing protein n=1 Tax=Lentzea cavernae TaxID=2020703 RepID=A0ABQ3MIL9_9PSEU|nr:hypothetical protein [Lentzea cavernae]GHH44205.1 hypothetical protein GCM10017774_43380 [Lentzea cavernae]